MTCLKANDGNIHDACVLQRQTYDHELFYSRSLEILTPKLHIRRFTNKDDSFPERFVSIYCNNIKLFL